MLKIRGSLVCEKTCWCNFLTDKNPLHTAKLCFTFHLNGFIDDGIRGHESGRYCAM